MVNPVILLPLLFKGAAAWGALGHETVGYVAQEFLAPKALAFVQSSLGSTYSESLGPAATWADDVKSEKAYSWSSDLHYVDAEGKSQPAYLMFCSRDSGLWKRTVYFDRRRELYDSGCPNFTECNPEAGGSEVSRPCDIGQPLHVEAKEVGGNDISAICGGSSTNLHAAWDTGILTKNVNENQGGTAQVYASDLITRIKTGSYESLTTSWLSCTSITEPASRKRSIEDDVNGQLFPRATITPLECPLVWARESNAYDCSVVFNFQTGQDLCTGTYYNNAVPVIDLQLAKQGYRLAAWLNVIFDGTTNLR